MRHRPWLWRDTTRRRLALLTLILFLLANYGPGTLVLAVPQLFVRPGAGVSRLPLEVMAFEAPGFGELEEAINLASGNLYVGTDQLGRNNLATSGTDETTITIGGRNWNLLPRLRLAPYSNGLSSPPASFFLGKGDGSGQTFNRVTTDFASEPLKSAPSWIQRYKSAGTAPLPDVHLYALAAQPGTQYSQEWVVLLIRPSGRTIAHYYIADGTRYSFNGDGQFVSYSQTPHQQYRGARFNNDPEGEKYDTGSNPNIVCKNTTNAAAPCTPRTDFFYTGGGSGMISKVRDEWGRVSVYTWDTALKTLQRIDYLVRDQANPATTWSRQVEFGYKAFVGQPQNLLGWVTYRAPDGMGGTLERRFEFDYDQRPGGRVVLKAVKRSAAGQNYAHVTIYDYDSSDRVIRVDPPGDGALVYTYGTGSDAGGAKVTVTECKNARLQDGLPACDDSASRKYAEYHFDPAGQLAKRREREHNPWVAQNSWTQRPDERWRAWTYSYWPDGSTKEVTGPYTEGEAEPRKLYLEYDARGNVKLERLSLGANVVREKTWTYTADNRLLSENIPAYPGTGFNYSAVRESSSYTDHPAVSVNGQTFRAVEWAETSTLVRNGDIWFTQYTLADRYDEAGRLARSERRLPGQPDKTQTTTYAYHSGSGTWQPYVPDANGSYAPAGPLVRQYADLVYERDHQGRLGRYFYDALGNVNHELLPGQHTADYSGATEVRHYRWAFRSYNGFGQQVWEHLFVSPDGNNGVTPARRMWFYLPTGELDHSWEGQPTNVTDYEYHTSGGNVGRLKKVTRGVGAGGSVTTVRETTEVPAADGYDAYGRRVKWTVDGFGYAAQYDTLDRLVRETLPDGGYTGMAYHASGERDIEFFYPANSRLDTILGWVKAVDGLGRVASTSYDAHTWGSVNSGQRGAQVRTFYDPFDRPIRVEDDRLTMNNPGEDRTTYFVYDSTGNLVKRLDPPLRTNGNVDMGGVSPGYTDGRRPYVEYSYDTLGRRTQERRLLAGNVTPAQVYNNLYGSFATCGSSAVACTSTAYDVLDRPVTVTDPEGYATTLAYDPAGNLVSKTQQVWTGSEPDYATLNGNFTSVTTRYAYDGVGRVVETIDPRGYTRGVTYDILGNLRQEWDERGVLVKNYTYTDDGLLSAVLEPDNVAGTPANVLGDGHVTTKALEYGSRRFPTRTCVAHMDTQAGAEAACTSHTYDYAGRVLSDTLPDNSTVVITYDSRGNRTSLKDAEGFVTEYTHDAWGNLVQELKKSRGNQTDSASGFPDGSGLLSQYWYDYAGNLVKQRSNGAPGEDNTGLYTEYAYNSLGKVVRETRPHRQDLIPNMRMKTYRLDGRLTAETTYDYSGDLAGKVASVGVDNMPTVSAGNATVYEYNRRGDKTREASQASPVTSPIHPALNWDGRERTVTFQYNGLGLLVKRLFTGTDRVYATQRDADGRPLTQRVDVVINGITLPYYVGNVNHNSYRRHDANSNLVESWDTPTSASGDSTPISANDKQNRYTYQYSSTNKESYHTRDVRFKVRSYYNTPNHDFSNGALMAATIGSATTVYNERDQINSVNYYDEAPKDWSATGKATSNIVTYSYYRSGLKKRALTGDGNYTDYVYDKRGRVTTVTDSNGGRDNTGGTTIPGPAVTSTTYDPDGTQTQELKTGSTLRYKLVTRPTLSGLTGSTDEWTVQGMLQSPAHPVSQVTVYRATGHPYAGLPYRSTTTTAQGWPGPENAYSSTTSTATFTYDGYGNRTQHAQETVTTGRRWNSDCQCYRPFDETSSYVPKTAAYNGVNAVTSETVGTPPGCSDSTCYGYTLTYTLSSRGDRLSVSDSRGAKPFTYHGRSKRYDAEGRAAIFQITEDSNTYPASKPAGKTSNYTAFRYDPFGSQVLAANGWTWEQDGSNQAQHAMYRETYTNVVVGGRVHTTRRQWGQMAWYWHLYGWEHRTEWNSNNVYKDEAYSLADGALESPWTAVMPYGTYAMFVKPPVLALPTAALSSQLRLSVGNVSLLDLRPPAAGPSGNTNTPAPPARLTQPDQGQQGQPQTFSLSGSASLTLTLLNGGDGTGTGLDPAGVALPGLGGRGGQAGAESAAQFGLSLPTSVLPPALQALDALDLRAPAPQDNPGAGSGLTPPGGGVVPPIAGVPAPVDAVVPPIGSSPPAGWPPGEARPFDELSVGSGGGSAADNDDASVKNQQEQDKDLGKKIAEEQKRATQAMQDMCVKLYGDGVDCGVYAKDIANSPLYNSLPESQRLRTWQTLSLGLARGRIGVDELRDVAAFYNNTRYTHDPSKATEENPLGGLLSGGLDVVPVLGDAKGLIEAVLGKDLLTGRELRGAERWLGLLGIIGLGEARSILKMGKWGWKFGVRNTDEAVDFAKSCLKDNSFSADTKVATAQGLVAIAALTAGVKVLAYDEATGKNEYRPVLEQITPGVIEKRVTYLTLRDDETGLTETLTTTKGHPFYLVKNVDSSARPAPEGHEDLALPWVGAGDLKVGDKVRQADGTAGTVLEVQTAREVRQMYNLDVATVDTFYVGEGRWLVHNQSKIDPKLIYFSQDSANWFFKDGRTIGELIEGLKSGKIDPNSIPPIRLVEKDGKLFTLDNRRLYAYQQAGIEVPYRMATPDEIARDQFKFTTKNGGVSIRIRNMPCS